MFGLMLLSSTSQQLLNDLSPIWLEQGWSLPEDENWSLALCELLGPSLTMLKDGIDQAEPIFTCPELEDDGLKQLEADGAKQAIGELMQSLENDPWDGHDTSKAQELLTDAASKAGVKELHQQQQRQELSEEDEKLLHMSLETKKFKETKFGKKFFLE